MGNCTVPEKGKIAVLVKPKQIYIKELPIPEINDDEILVKVEGCGICGTDVYEYKADPFGYAPIQLGHEGTGTIVKIGKNVTKDYRGKSLSVGDRIVTGLRPCGVCDICTKHPERIHLCNSGEIFGLLPGKEHFFNGWFGEYMKVNKGGVVFNVSDMDLDLRLLIEPSSVVVHAVEKAKEIFDFRFDSNVLVQGLGPIGLLLLTVVRCMGVRNIIAVDGDKKRLDMAKELGAKYTINFKDYSNADETTKAIANLTDGYGADCAFQCTGSPIAASNIWKYVRRGGSMCELGFFTNNGSSTINPHLDICNKEIKVTGSWTYKSEDWISSFDFLKEASGRGLPVTKLITHRFPLDKINDAMETNISMAGIKIAIING